MRHAHFVTSACGHVVGMLLEIQTCPPRPPLGGPGGQVRVGISEWAYPVGMSESGHVEGVVDGF